MDLESLVEMHTKRHKRVTHYCRQTTIVLALVCLVFFGTIILYDVAETNMKRLSGMAVYVTEKGIAQAVEPRTADIAGFVHTVKKSPHITEYKLFFYTMWILVVLIGSAINFEIKNHGFS